MCCCVCTIKKLISDAVVVPCHLQDKYITIKDFHLNKRKTAKTVNEC